MMPQARHKELTKHIRKQIRIAGVKARVHMGSGNGGNITIVVAVPSYEARFTSEEIRSFCHTAKCNRLTFVRGLEIDVDLESELTGRHQWDFYIPDHKE